MVVNPLKAFLFIAGGATAAVGTAYVSGALDPYLVEPKAAAVAAVPETAAPAKPAAPKGERLPQQAAPPGTATPAPDRSGAGGHRAVFRSRARRIGWLYRRCRQGCSRIDGGNCCRRAGVGQHQGRGRWRFRHRAQRAAEAWRSRTGAALDHCGQGRGDVARNGGRFHPRPEARPGSGAGRKARRAEQADHRA